MIIWMRVLNDVTSAMGTADLFTVFWTKSAMVGYSSPARVPGNMTDNHKVDAGGYEPDFIGRGTEEIAQKKRRTMGTGHGGIPHNRLPVGNVLVYGR